MSVALREDAIESGLIDERYHDLLLADLAGLTRQAGIPESYVWTSIHNYCGERECDFVSQLKEPDCPLGMVYMGNIGGRPINERMMAIAGACLRNYINAKVMTVYDVLAALKDGDMPSPTVLLIPDFYDGNKVPEWQKNGLLGLLYKREQHNQKTVLYVSDRKGMIQNYGQPFADHMAGKFVPITH